MPCGTTLVLRPITTEHVKMKLGKITVLVGIIAMTVLVVAVDAANGDPEKDVFVVKAEKELVGGKIEVFAESGRLITAQTLRKRKMMIDFGDTKTGAYIIRLTKGKHVQEFRFEKKK